MYYDIGEMYLDTDAEKATEYYFKLKTLSERLNWVEVALKQYDWNKAEMYLQKSLNEMLYPAVGFIESAA